MGRTEEPHNQQTYMRIVTLVANVLSKREIRDLLCRYS